MWEKVWTSRTFLLIFNFNSFWQATEQWPWMTWTTRNPLPPFDALRKHFKMNSISLLNYLVLVSWAAGCMEQWLRGREALRNWIEWGWHSASTSSLRLKTWQSPQTGSPQNDPGCKGKETCSSGVHTSGFTSNKKTREKRDNGSVSFQLNVWINIMNIH